MGIFLTLGVAVGDGCDDESVDCADWADIFTNFFSKTIIIFGTRNYKHTADS